MTPGIDTLLSRHPDWIQGKRLAAIVHAASRTADGTWTADKLRDTPDINLRALMGPEHGIESSGAAGEEIAHGRHARLNLPVWSLHGDSRKPTGDMLEDIDVLLFDLQDISVRCYTYASTLHGVMEACDATAKTLVIADRPSPLMNIVDGPMLEPEFRSFVGDIPTPLVYGMTSGELAHFLQRTEYPNLDLRIAPCQDLDRETFSPDQLTTWVPPSPAIRSTACACCYPSTVFIEGIPAIDTSRSSKHAFQVLASPWMDAEQVTLRLQARRLPGVDFEETSYTAVGEPYEGQTVQGIHITIEDPNEIKPAALMLNILDVLQSIHGPDPLWKSDGIRPEWFDKLMGTSTVREQLTANTPVQDIIASWDTDRSAFLTQRAPSLFY